MRRAESFVVLFVLVLARPLAAGGEVPLVNWPVPSTPAAKSGPALHGDITRLLPFVAIEPCRLVDTRGNGAPIQGGAFGAGEERTYEFSKLCGLPDAALTLSLNVTATETAGAGFITAWTSATPLPQTSTLNYAAGQTVSNAAIVTASHWVDVGLFAAVSFVAGVSGTHLIVDVNGYFPGPKQSSPFDNELRIFTPFASPGIVVKNSNEDCNLWCGIHASIDSVVGQPAAVFGESLGLFGGGIGVSGETAGDGTQIPSPRVPAGVSGRAGYSGSIHAIRGEVGSSSKHAAGVASFATAAASSAGRFSNDGALYLVADVGTRIGAVFYALQTFNDVSCGELTTPIDHFVAPHPEDASREIAYVSLAAPAAEIYFRGRARLVDGVARIAVPRHFALSAREGSYATTATAIGDAPIPLAIEHEGADGIVVRGRADVAFHYVVHGERAAMADHDPTPANVHFGDDARQRLERAPAAASPAR